MSISFLFSFLLIWLGSSKAIVGVIERPPLMIPPENTEHFTFGYRESISDSLWIRSIQDFEYCGQNKTSEHVKNNSSSNENTNITPELVSSLKAPRCARGWIFHMLNEVTDLSPKFEIAYEIGVAGLSIIVDDREGAEALFDKGVDALPKNWQIPYMAGYHAIFETQNFEKAGKLLKIAGDRGAPEWVYFLASQVYTKAGQAQLAKQVITKYISNFEPDKVPERAKQRLAEAEDALKKSSQQ